MKIRTVVIEVICFLLMMNVFYEGVHKLAYFTAYGFYLRHMPAIKPVAGWLNYIVPFGEIILSVFFMVPKQRKTALYILIAASLVMIFWVMYCTFVGHIVFFPFEALWKKPNWMQKTLFTLLLCYGAFTVLLLSGKKGTQKSDSMTLANIPAN